LGLEKSIATDKLIASDSPVPSANIIDHFPTALFYRFLDNKRVFKFND
jgi:hypothetical protein